MLKSSITFFLFFVTFFINAQYKDLTDAEIYLKSGEILKGKARLTMIEAKGGFPLSSDSKEYLIYFNTDIKQRKGTKFSPEEVEKTIFDLDLKVNGRRVKKQTTYIPIIKNEKKGKLGFAKLIIDGTIKLVRRSVSNTSDNRLRIYKESLLVRDNNEAIVFNYAELKSFKKRALEYFSDCSSLVSKIEDEKYKRNDLEDLVNYYNDNCAK
jgi:hypothetical protein